MTGNRVAYPLLISIANMKMSHCMKGSHHAFQLLGLLPVAKFMHSNKRARSLLQDRLTCHGLLIFFLWHVTSHVTVTPVTVTPVTVTVTCHTCHMSQSHVTVTVTHVTCHRPGVTQDCDVSSIRSHNSKAILRSRVCLSLIDYINGVASWINGLWSDSLEEVWNWV